MPASLNKEKAKKNLAEILDRIHSDTDPALLSEYYKLYKKEISFFRRSWAAAWLFMYYDKREAPNGHDVKKRTQSDKFEFDNTLPEEISKRLFISIGKNRRLFPREIITLITSKTSASREDIGVIKILDNYSFVQVRDAKADEIIKNINGLRFRGRTLIVNYAKPKETLTEPQQ